MTRKKPRAPRAPTLPPAGGRAAPRRPGGGVPASTVTTAAGSSAVERVEMGDNAYVKRDLRRIGLIAVLMFAIILAAPYLL